jgi:hypothetical protein
VTPAVYDPDDTPAWEPTPMRTAEQTWLAQARAQQQRDAHDRPRRSLQYRMRKAVDRWSLESGWVALGLVNATAAAPPPARPSRGPRRSGMSDPTLAVTASTISAVERTADRWAHLIGPCPNDGQYVSIGQRDDESILHECPAGSILELADALTGFDDGPSDGLSALERIALEAHQLVDGLIGTPSSSRAAWNAIVSRAAKFHSAAATTIAGAWQEAWRAGAEPEQLERWADMTATIAGRSAAIAGGLAHWSGREEPRCAAGCGGAGPGTCDRCRQQASRARRRES